MIKNYENFSNDNVGIVGIPSGEYIEVTNSQLSVLVLGGYVNYNADVKALTFNDRDYHEIIRELPTKKDKIKKFLKIIGLERYKINDDYSIDALENVKIKIPLHNLPVTFDYIMGHFDISNCGLESLQGCPDSIEGDFICTGNKLESLEFGPKEVNGDYDVRNNLLKSLMGTPLRIKKNFCCSNNNLNDLVGGPRFVGGSYYADNCLLTSLRGSPFTLVGHFDCSYNLLETLGLGPSVVEGTYNCSNNNLRDLEFGPKSVGIFKCNGNKNLRDFSHKPKYIKIISDEI